MMFEMIKTLTIMLMVIIRYCMMTQCVSMITMLMTMRVLLCVYGMILLMMMMVMAEFWKMVSLRSRGYDFDRGWVWRIYDDTEWRLVVMQ